MNNPLAPSGPGNHRRRFALPFKPSALAFLLGFGLMLWVYPPSDAPAISGAPELAVSMVLISLLGIPHGSIDNVLFLRQHPHVRKQRFHLTYLATITANVLLWIFFPLLGYVSFMFVSAFHFGESQFSHYALPKFRLKHAFHFTWGLSILAGMSFWNLPEISQLVQQDASFLAVSAVNNAMLLGIFLGLTLAGTLAGLVWLVSTGRLKTREFIVELVLLLFIQLALYLFPLIVGFSLYFLTLHSWKVLREEFDHVKASGLVTNLRGFIQLLTPFSLVSILGIAGLFALTQTGLFPQSFAYAFTILISCITVPHAYVMHHFYRQR